MKIWEKGLNDLSSGEEGRATRRLALDALSFASFKRRVVRWIGETTCRLNGGSSAWERRRSHACGSDIQQTTCRLRSGRTTCRSRPMKQNPSLIKTTSF